MVAMSIILITLVLITYENFVDSYSHLYWRSAGSNQYYDGVLVSKDHYIEENGNYRIMFNYRIQQNYRNSGSNNGQI